jgi:hypothetical protein
MWILSLVIAIILLWLVVSFITSAIIIVRPYEAAIVERLGRYQRTLYQGLHFVIPFLDRVIKVDLRERVVDVPPQEVITRDNVLSYKFVRKTTEGAKEFSPTSVVGKEGRVVLVDGDKVVVRVEGEDWLAEGEGEFKVGDKVVVLEVLGNKIRIKRR